VAEYHRNRWPTIDRNIQVDNAYAPQAEGSVLFSDPILNIKWPLAKEKLTLSDKDFFAPLLENADLFD